MVDPDVLSYPRVLHNHPVLREIREKSQSELTRTTCFLLKSGSVVKIPEIVFQDTKSWFQVFLTRVSCQATRDAVKEGFVR